MPIREFAKAELMTETGALLAEVRAVLTKSTTQSGRTEWHGVLMPLTRDDESKLLLVDQGAFYILRSATGAEGKVLIKDPPVGFGSGFFRVDVLGNGDPPF